ncbi:hypothetical protein [Accumulibacter sp.]|uniref:hypothetical protein n=1 Tax=Accumulibacter sp. TaxID=2053492 RepID=UPI0025F5A5D4|nr:hypothetical protein [Accumulibacter sp.]MCM8593788.1 hypothetical protein [Accumulibacter sp.]MDS4047929.1 hypothetical protein [Accumulibacter sp.]
MTDAGADRLSEFFTGLGARPSSMPCKRLFSKAFSFLARDVLGGLKQVPPERRSMVATGLLKLNLETLTCSRRSSKAWLLS